MTANVWANPGRPQSLGRARPAASAGGRHRPSKCKWRGSSRPCPPPVSWRFSQARRGTEGPHGRASQQGRGEQFPNLRIAYLSSRIYAGYARTHLNPEPYAYESAFVVRWLIQDQIKGESLGRSKSPLSALGAVPLGRWGEGPEDRRSGLEAGRPRAGWHAPQRQRTAEGGRVAAAVHEERSTAKMWFIRSE